MWNNVKYGKLKFIKNGYYLQRLIELNSVGMKLKPNFSKESPVWLLGMCYRKLEAPTDLTELGTDVAAFQSQHDVSVFFYIVVKIITVQMTLFGKTVIKI